MAEGKVTVIARIKAKTGEVQRVKEELLKLLAPTRAENACINFDMHQGAADHSQFLFHENWTSEAAPQTKRAPAASRPSRSIASAKSAATAAKVPGAPAPGGKAASTSPWTRPGWASAKRRAVRAPIERPPTIAALASTWSRTRPRSATNASGVYADASAGASLRACPRASKRTIR